MKLIHKVEECAIYESNKHSYASIPLVPTTSTSSLPSLSLKPVIKSFLLKITSSSSSTSEAAHALLSSITKSMKHADARNHHAHTHTHTSSSIKFKALKAMPLKSLIEEIHSPSSSSSSNMLGMAYTLTLKLLADIGTQLERIQMEHGFVIPFLSLEDIVVIETMRVRVYEGGGEPKSVKPSKPSEPLDPSEYDYEYTFIFMNAEKLVQEPGSNKKELIIDVPLKVNKHTSFLPAELPESALKRLPMRVTTTSWQYSLSALCIYALLQHKFKNGEDDIERVGRPFLHTSLYFCLKRCLKPDPEDRVLLYI